MAARTRRGELTRALPEIFEWAESLPEIFAMPTAAGFRGIRVEEFLEEGEVRRSRRASRNGP